jgi:hypothetical protein
VTRSGVDAQRTIGTAEKKVSPHLNGFKGIRLSACC